MRMRTLCRAAAIVASVLPLALSACGISVDVPAASSSPSASTASQATLTCQEHSEVDPPQDPGPPKVTHDLTCDVTDAPNSETAFTLQYQLKDSDKRTLTYGPTCNGTLQNGKGDCFQKYTEVVDVFNRAMPRVSGTLLPSGQTLVPVIPTMPVAAKLTCTDQVKPNSAERLHDLTCKVAGAPSSETSFTLQYTLSDSTGTTETFPSRCEGALQYGAGKGTCVQVYVEDVGVFTNPQAAVFGELLPSREPLGPITLPDPL